jgi:hypothetical protein
MSVQNSVTDATPDRYTHRYDREARCLIVVNGAGHVAATFDITQGCAAEAEAHRLNYELAAAWPVVIRNGMVSRRKAVA